MSLPVTKQELKRGYRTISIVFNSIQLAKLKELAKHRYKLPWNMSHAIRRAVEDAYEIMIEEGKGRVKRVSEREVKRKRKELVEEVKIREILGRRVIHKRCGNNDSDSIDVDSEIGRKTELEEYT